MTKTLCALALAALIVSVQAQTKSNQPNQNASKAQNTQALRSEEVGDLLNATNEARIAVEARNSQDAIVHVDHALQNASRLESDTKSARFVPLYQELDRYTVLAPIMTEKNRTGNTTGSQGANTTAKTNQPPNAAKTAIEQKDFNKADQALAAVQTGVVVTSVASDLPLLRARENMVLAREAANRGNFKEAHTALTAASQALGNYANNSGTHSSDART